MDTIGRKPPLQTFFVHLSITNHRDYAVWYITHYYGDRALPKKEPFKASSPWKLGYLICNAYNGERFGGKGQFRTIRFLGADRPASHSFVAFLLAAGAHLEHDRFPIDTWSDITNFEIWEASAMKVNGKTLLEDWLPLEVLTWKETHITRQASEKMIDSGAFQWKPGKSKADFPGEDVTANVPTVLTRWQLPVKGVLLATSSAGNSKLSR